MTFTLRQEDNYMGDFAKRLKGMRLERGWTRYRLAKLSGLTGEGVRKLETRGSDPKLSTLFKLSAAFNAGLPEILTGVAPEPEKRRNKRPSRV
jgi:transcriptional regulator with XRE-family HTH domain